MQLALVRRQDVLPQYIARLCGLSEKIKEVDQERCNFLAALILLIFLPSSSWTTTSLGPASGAWGCW